ncbi:hypothetical protein [Haloactinomyces albus]|uniref:Uncharacterized protein n=1 Tax=Haloactinomyces albus TaxID=1352928 RepID=A0AAE3ZBM4_9ACTN|nr:hypothetical protein [Haloactinomyces albus]MDR7300149.1 hypothetical protein [Haloactinomyces albus]
MAIATIAAMVVMNVEATAMTKKASGADERAPVRELAWSPPLSLALN